MTRTVPLIILGFNPFVVQFSRPWVIMHNLYILSPRIKSSFWLHCPETHPVIYSICSIIRNKVKRSAQGHFLRDMELSNMWTLILLCVLLLLLFLLLLFEDDLAANC